MSYNYSPRYALIRQLASGHDAMTREEIRYLRLVLPSYHPDFVVELPLEIVILIALQLNRRDFARCLSVSRPWRERLLSDPVTAAYAASRWPALTNGAIGQARFLELLSRLGWASRILVFMSSETRAAVGIDCVPWDATAPYQLDPTFHYHPDTVPGSYTFYPINNHLRATTALYYSGKVACHLCGDVVIIDDLKLKSRKVLTPPSGIMYGSPIKLQALGSRLVVASIDRMIIAWDHVDNKAYEKSLPCRSLKCATCDDRVAIMLYGGNVVVWTPGHAVVQLDVSSVIREPSIPLSTARPWETVQDVFFNARDKRTLYLASLFRDEPNGRLHVTVKEFSPAGYIDTFSSELLDPEEPGARLKPIFELSEYEFDRSCIIFGERWRTGGYSIYALFDKIERKFTTYGPKDQPTWTFEDDPAALPLKKLRKVAIDLDFAVRADTDSPYYEVVASKQVYLDDNLRSRIRSSHA